MALSKTERLMLANQYRILEVVVPEEAAYYAKMREALEEGYVSAYEQVFENVDDGLSEEDCRFVGDTLAVYDALQLCYDNLSDKSGIDEGLLLFPGFAGNYEARHLGYCQFVVKKEKRFEGVRLLGNNYNSPARMIPLYANMIAKHKEFGERSQLRWSECQSILDVVTAWRNS
jgi:uncharacterized protein YfbU (UPF0304 family)